MRDLHGAFATIITPFKEGNLIDETELRKEIAFLCDKKITGLFPLATTSEFPFLQLDEKEKYLRVVAEENAGRKALLAGCCGINYTETMKLIGFAVKYGYDAAVVCSPYYYTQGKSELVKYYTKLAENEYGMPIILYNIPMFTSEISLDAIAQLIDNKNIIGIKDSSGNMHRMISTVDIKNRAGRDDFIVYSGSDDIILPGLIAGNGGNLSAMPALIPEIVDDMYDAYNAGDIEKAKKIQASFVELSNVAGSLPFPVGYKILAKLRGINVGHIHQFYDEKSAEAVEKRERELLAELNLV